MPVNLRSLLSFGQPPGPPQSPLHQPPADKLRSLRRSRCSSQRALLRTVSCLKHKTKSLKLLRLEGGGEEGGGGGGGKQESSGGGGGGNEGFSGGGRPQRDPQQHPQGDPPLEHQQQMDPQQHPQRDPQQHPQRDSDTPQRNPQRQHHPPPWDIPAEWKVLLDPFYSASGVTAADNYRM